MVSIHGGDETNSDNDIDNSDHCDIQPYTTRLLVHMMMTMEGEPQFQRRITTCDADGNRINCAGSLFKQMSPLAMGICF